MTVSVAESKFLWAVRQQESRGNYSATNPSGALGAYQILASNLPSWEKQAGLQPETGSQFLNDKAYQDELATAILGGYYNKYGDAGAAAMWYSGQPDPTKTYGNPPVSTYVADVLGLENQAPSTGIGNAGSSGISITSAPATPAGSVTQGLLGGLGFTDTTDVLERGALIVLGALFVIIAFLRFTDAGRAVAGKMKTVGKVATL